MDQRDDLATEVTRLWQDLQSLAHIRIAHKEVRAGQVLRLKEPLTIKRLIELAHSIE
jgi:hypothetical protein